MQTILRWMFKLLISELGKKWKVQAQRNELQVLHSAQVPKSIFHGGSLLIQNCTCSLGQRNPWVVFPLPTALPIQPPILVLIKQENTCWWSSEAAAAAGMDLTAWTSHRRFSLQIHSSWTVLLYRDGVLQRVLDLGLAQEDVPAAHAPQHPLERGDALAVDHASHEPARGQHGLRGCTWATPEPATQHTMATGGWCCTGSYKNLVMTLVLQVKWKIL